MKLHSLSKFLFLCLGLGLVLVSCESEPVNPPVTNAASISFDGTSGADVTVAPGEEFSVMITASESGSLMSSIEVKEDGTSISLERVKYDGTAAGANPALLFDTEKSNFSKTVTVKAHTDIATRPYSFEIKTEDNSVSSLSLSVTTTGDPATVSINGPASFETNPGTNNSIKVQATAGTGKITTIEVLENGVTMTDLDRVSFGNYAMDANPYTLPEEYANGIDEMLFLKAPAAEGTYEYTIKLTDDAGLESSTSFTMVVVPTGTPVTVIEGVLFNAGGPAGTGGLDLDLGISVGSDDSEAEIKDEGIDNDLPAASNWLQQISGVKGASVVALVAGQNGLAEDFAFAGVTFKEDIPTYFEAGTAFTQMNSDGELISDKIEAGTVFAVKDGEKFYVVEVAEVNVSPTDNGDNYKMNIKY